MDSGVDKWWKHFPRILPRLLPGRLTLQRSSQNIDIALRHPLPWNLGGSPNSNFAFIHNEAYKMGGLVGGPARNEPRPRRAITNI